MYSGSLRMNDLNRRLVEIINRLRDELHIVSHRTLLIRDDLARQRQEIAKADQANQQNKSREQHVTAILNTPKHIQAEERKARSDQRKYQCRNLVAAWAGVFVVAAYTTIAALEWGATREASYQDQRPWVAGDHWEFPFKVRQGFPNAPCTDQSCVGIYIRNVGRTPAINVRAGAKITIASDDSGLIQEPADERPVRGVLPNDNTSTWFAEHISPDELAEYANIKRMYVRVRIQYCDIWGNANRTDFCIYHDSTTPPEEFWPCQRIKSRVWTGKGDCENQ